MAAGEGVHAMKARKFTVVELSRILSEHEAGALRCLEEVPPAAPWSCTKRCNAFWYTAGDVYRPTWPAEWVLRALEKAGLA
jgi:hypothetical protein